MTGHTCSRLVSMLALVLLLSPSLVLADRLEVPSAPTYNRDAHWFTSLLDDNPDSGKYISIALNPISDAPWVSYYQSSNQNLMVAHYVGQQGGTCGPGHTWLCQLVDGANNVGQYSSIDVYSTVVGDPAYYFMKVGVTYAYMDSTFTALRYAEYSFKSPGGWAWRTYEIQRSDYASVIFGHYTSLKYDSSGVAHIAYSADYGEYPQPSLRYAYRVGDGSGNCGDGNNWQCEIILESCEDPIYCSLSSKAMISSSYPSYQPSLDISSLGYPYIAYYDFTEESLGIAMRNFPWGGGDCGPEPHRWSCTIIDQGGVGMFPSLHAIRDAEFDHTRIAYYDAVNGQLKYAYAVNSGGNCGEFNGWQCDNIENIGANLAMVGISMAVDKDNRPVIAYMNASDALGPATLNIAYPRVSGNCGPLSPISRWQCDVIDVGGAYQNEAQFVDLAIGSNYLTTIAYSELDSYEYPNVDYLKIAYQREMLYMPVINK